MDLSRNSVMTKFSRQYLLLLRRCLCQLACAWATTIPCGLRANDSDQKPPTTAVVSEQPPRTLRRVSEIRQLTPLQVEERRPIVLSGVVTYYDPIWRMFFVQDETGGIYVDYAGTVFPIDAGDSVELTGLAAPGLYGPIVVTPSVRLHRKATLPVSRPKQLKSLQTADADSQWVTVVGVVHASRVDDFHQVLEVAANGGRFEAIFPASPSPPESSHLIDAEVRISGVCALIMDQHKKVAGFKLFSPSMKQIHVIEPAPRDPFSLPLRKIQSLRNIQALEAPLHRTRISGVVTFQGDQRSVYIQDGPAGLQLLLKDPFAFKPGDIVEATGFPLLEKSSFSLRETLVRQTGSGPSPTPVTVPVGQPIGTDYDSSLVSVEGRFLEFSNHEGQPVIVVQLGDQILYATAPGHDLSDLELRLQPGCSIILSGVCTTQHDGEGQPRFYRIWLRSSADIEVLTKSVGRLDGHAYLMAVATCTVAMAALAWVFVLRRRVRKQRAAIAEGMQSEAILETRYRELFENAKDTVFTTDLSGQFTSLNRAGELLTGYQRAELTGQSLSSLVLPEDRDRLTSLLPAKDSRSDMTACELSILTKDGRKILLELSARSIRQDGKFIGVQGIARDISSRRKLEEQLRQSQKMEAIGRLAGGVAHDFNNLLTVISGYSELALHTIPEKDAAQGCIHEIQKASDRAASLTRQLLAFSRKQVLAPTTLSLNTVVSSMEKMLGRLIGEDIQLITDLDAELGSVKADLGQIEQVLLNLAVNARDAMPHGGRLTLGTANVFLDEIDVRDYPEAKPGLYVMISVTDTGCGMTDDVRSRIFEPFFTTKEAGKGTGLGLATVYGIISQSEGHVAVTSRPGHGTQFRLYLPRTNATASDMHDSEAPKNISGGKEVVLLVEDDDSVRSLARHILQRSGYEVLVASDGPEALNQIELHTRDLDLMITDMVMPMMNGRELAERVSVLRPNTKILFLSGYTDDAIFRHGLSDEEVNFLQKPFRPDALAAKVRAILDEPVHSAEFREASGVLETSKA